MTAPLFLIGFMAAGKTSVGHAIADATARRFIDLDEMIELGDARSVGELVARDEPEFRRREAAALRGAILRAGDGPVIATGGGCAAHDDNLANMMSAGCVVALGVDLAEARTRAESDVSARPLLSNAEQLLRQRISIYRRAHAVVDTMGRTIGQVAREVAAVERVWRTFGPGWEGTIVALGERSYPISIVDAWASLAPRAQDIVITDRNVAHHHALPGCEANTLVVEPGEASKSFALYASLCEQLVARGLDRGSEIFALGGGVIGDLAGFVAATLFRGISIVHLPTTLVAMVDSAIGGKTAIDLPAGKNLVGAFHQPRLVHVNVATLATLPARERKAGFGELWKYALLDGEELWRAVEACASWANADDGTSPAGLGNVIRAGIAYKAAVVGRDERERSGHRALLNLGHTVGHAIEAASQMLHGEAVGLGLVAACRVSAALGLASPDLEERVVTALQRTGLPHDLAPHLGDQTLSHLVVDKKRVGDHIRFIAIREVGVCESVEIAVTELPRILRSTLRA
jgi:shikimate kinase/3-dehydroquinate synthase